MMGYQFDHGDKDVASAGSAEQMTDGEFFVRSCVIQAKSTNTGKVFIGGAGVDSSCHYLNAGETFSLPLGAVQKDMAGHDLNKVYLDVETDDEGVTFTYIK